MKAQDRRDRSVRDERGGKKDTDVTRENRAERERERERERATAVWDVQKFCQRHPDGLFLLNLL